MRNTLVGFSAEAVSHRDRLELVGAMYGVRGVRCGKPHMDVKHTSRIPGLSKQNIGLDLRLLILTPPAGTTIITHTQKAQSY